MRNLCIDFGSTFIKFFILNENEIIYKNKILFPNPCIDNGVKYEVGLKEINSAVFEIFEEVKDFKIDKCFIAVQMHGYVLKDMHGEFSNYVSWKDKRGNLSNENLKKIDFNRNGTSLKNNLPAVKLMEQNVNGFIFYTLGSYIAYILTGRNSTHITDGCASGFFEVETLTPLKIFENLSLPTITREVQPLGKFHGIEIYAPIGDHQLSFLGSSAEENAYLLNIGTATQLSTLSQNCECWDIGEKRPYFNQYRLLTISGLTGGEKLYQGYPLTDFCDEIWCAIKKLPPKNKVLLGGGGAKLVFKKLKPFLNSHNIECLMLEENISEIGMEKLSNMCNIKIGTMLSEVCFSNFPVILKNEKIDFLIIDNEHGAFDYSFFSSIIMTSRLVDLPVIVRISDNSRKDITKFVDMGVTGFLLPMTNNGEDIKKVVDFAKYAPIGKRGISTNRAHTLYNPPPIDEYMQIANNNVKVYAQIETHEGVDNIEEILSVNGVDGVFVGPNDLSCDLGCIGNNEPIKDVLKTVSNVAHSKNKKWGIITTSKDLIECSLENSADYISYGSEINMLKDSCKNIRRNIYD